MNDENELRHLEFPPSMLLSKIAPVAQHCAESVEREFGPDAKIVCVTVVVEVVAPVPGGGMIDSVEYESSEYRRWVQLAMLNEAAAKAETLNEARIENVEDFLAVEQPTEDDDD